MEAARPFEFSIDLPVVSEWGNVDLMRTSVQNCFTAMFQSVEGCHTIAMVVGELLENAVKYGEWQGERGTFRLRIQGAGRSAQVMVENAVRDGDVCVEELFRTLTWIDGYATAAEAYRARLLELAEAGVGSTFMAGRPSRLGLVRIAYEASCKLRADLKGGVLRVSAEVAL